MRSSPLAITPALSRPSVCIDGFNMALPKGSGIATYGRNLVHALNTTGRLTSILYGPAADQTSNIAANTAALADGPPPRSRVNKRSRWRRTLTSRFGRTAEFIPLSDLVIWSNENGGRPPINGAWSTRDLYSIAGRAFQKYGSVTPVSFRRSMHSNSPDVMHWTCPLPLHAPKAINLLTVHDLIPLRLPHTTTDDTSAYLRLCQTSVDRADHIVVVSETTRRDLIEILGVNEDRITNTYQAVSLPSDLIDKSQEDAILDIEETLGLGWQGYFLYFGAVEPKKNLARLIEAHLTSNVDAPLVIVGGRGWLNADENAFLEQLTFNSNVRSDRIRRFPYMPFHLLVSLIRGARGVVFPSLYEGFGLPVLEAMLLGAPVITSNAGSLPEVAGNAALSIDPYDISAIRDAIRQVDGDTSLRNELSQKGRLQAQRFSPENYSSAISKVYARLGV